VFESYSGSIDAARRGVFPCAAGGVGPIVLIGMGMLGMLALDSLTAPWLPRRLQ